MDIKVIVEIPQGSRNKYEMDHDTGRIRLDRMLSPPPATQPTTGLSPARWPRTATPWTC